VSVSAISVVTEEGHASSVAGFARAGVVYVAWVTPTGVGNLHRIQWKPHTGANFSEVKSGFAAPFQNLSTVYIQPSDRVLVAWDVDSGTGDGQVFTAQFDALTAALLSGPTAVAIGARPSLALRGGVDGSDVLLTYGLRSKGVPYTRYSGDGGSVWSDATPVLTNQVASLQDVEIVPFDDNHLSMVQLGKASRRLAELGSLSRTRPLVGIAAHPSLADRYFVVEPNGSSDLSDLLRGGLSVKRDGSGVLTFDGGRVGVDDSVGSLALLGTSGLVPTVVASATYAGSPDGDDISTFSLVPAYTSTTELDGALGKLVSADVSTAFAYVAEYSDVANPTTGGTLVVLRLSDLVSASVLSGLKACRAVGVGIPPSGTPAIFVATSEGSLEKLRIYTENGLTPAPASTHALPARANAVRVELASATSGTVSVSMVDRLNIYTFTSLSGPLSLRSSFLLPTGGQFFKTRLAANGNIVCAAGTAGVVVFRPTGRMISQLIPSTLPVSFWKPFTAFPLNSLMQPTSPGPFSAQRYYFKATTGGTTTGYHPTLALTGTIADGTVIWTPQATIDPVVTDVAVDQPRSRIYAVGLCGGAASTNGRVWTLNAAGLV
jgi:hypothetical protein